MLLETCEVVSWLAAALTLLPVDNNRARLRRIRGRHLQLLVPADLEELLIHATLLLYQVHIQPRLVERTALTIALVVMRSVRLVGLTPHNEQSVGVLVKHYLVQSPWSESLNQFLRPSYQIRPLQWLILLRRRALGKRRGRGGRRGRALIIQQLALVLQHFQQVLLLAVTLNGTLLLNTLGVSRLRSLRPINLWRASPGLLGVLRVPDGFLEADWGMLLFILNVHCI